MFSVKAAAFGVEALLNSGNTKKRKIDHSSSEEEELIIVDNFDHETQSSQEIVNTSSGLHVKTDLLAESAVNSCRTTYSFAHPTASRFEWSPRLCIQQPLRESETSHSLSVDDDLIKESSKSKCEINCSEECRRVISNKDIAVELHHHFLWTEFHQHQTEMIITKNGRRMFPVIKIRLVDLNPEDYYLVYLDISPIDAKRYRYAYPSSRWVVAGTGEPLSHEQLYMHPDSPALGKHWLDMSVISFDKLKLTNNRVGETKGQIFLHSMQKYKPRIWVQRIDNVKEQTPNSPLNNGFMNSAQAQVDKNKAVQFSFPETSFITVTAYQNQQITKLKINSNPFAKGFRENSKQKEAMERRFMTSISSDIPNSSQRFHLYASECQQSIPRFFPPLQFPNPFLPFFPVPPPRLSVSTLPWPFMPTLKPVGTFFPPLGDTLIPPYTLSHENKSYKEVVDVKMKKENT